MNYLIWRIHYRQVYFAIGALAALTILLLITGINMSNDYHRFFANCAATQSCGDASSVLFRGDGLIIDLVDATLVIPALFGLFWGAPILAKEYEDGTQNLAWSQGVTRRHWLSTNLMWVLLAAVVWGGAMALLVSWWRFPENALDSRFAAFDIQGIAPVVYSVFAVTLGIAVGSILKRVLPAVATTLGIFVVVRVLVEQFLRPHYMSPVTATFLVGAGPPPAAQAGAWIISGGLAGPGGQRLNNVIAANQIPGACTSGGPFPGKPVNVQCLAQHGFHQLITYQPASRFWAFQGIEAAIFVVLSAGLIALAYRMVLSRDA